MHHPKRYWESKGRQWVVLAFIASASLALGPQGFALATTAAGGGIVAYCLLYGAVTLAGVGIGVAYWRYVIGAPVPLAAYLPSTPSLWRGYLTLALADVAIEFGLSWPAQEFRKEQVQIGIITILAQVPVFVLALREAWRGGGLGLVLAAVVQLAGASLVIGSVDIGVFTSVNFFLVLASAAGLVWYYVALKRIGQLEREASMGDERFATAKVSTIVPLLTLVMYLLVLPEIIWGFGGGTQGPLGSTTVFWRAPAVVLSSGTLGLNSGAAQAQFLEGLAVWMALALGSRALAIATVRGDLLSTQAASTAALGTTILWNKLFQGLSSGYLQYLGVSLLVMGGLAITWFRSRDG